MAGEVLVLQKALPSLLSTAGIFRVKTVSRSAGTVFCEGQSPWGDQRQRTLVPPQDNLEVQPPVESVVNVSLEQEIHDLVQPRGNVCRQTSLGSVVNLRDEDVRKTIDYLLCA